MLPEVVRKHLLGGLVVVPLGIAAVYSSAATPDPAPQEQLRADTSAPIGLGATTDWRQWRGVLYRIQAPAGQRQSNDGAPVVSFILGTLHFGSLQELGMDTEALRTSLRQSRLFIDEAPGASADSAEESNRYRMLPASQDLVSLLGQPAFATLQRLLPALPAQQLRSLKPWVALALLESRGEMANVQPSLDGQLYTWAQQDDLPILHLETLADQLRALDCVPATEQVQVLRQRLNTPWLFSEQSSRVLEYYRAGDLPAWLDDIEAMTGLNASARHIEHKARLCLIEARNHRWLAQLDPLLRVNSAFVAVGAIHLTGSNGLLEQLRQRGFSISALPM